MELPRNPSPDEPLSAEQMRMLGEIGFFAANHGDLVRAEEIFQSLLVLRPNRDFPYLGLGITFLNGGRVQEAVSILERGQTMVPDSVDLCVFLAMALRASQRNAEANKLLTETLAAHREDTPTLRLAKQLLAS
ncbi:hypothetical protein RY831_16320 [Noviherbaspirillum sp. CPCC 100848]|uniref:Tetratricopeptide repeat protein n=1 Tax=Noviherbaspirillum album TaxID=3080276 RepID=A0ABU6JBN7_9BURK|nr:tetratricopeptide repeat protein [Noviherbaspirillum sp. CPCC 100848]MEC4720730.1 hypothetical protein [Noviherbaspirillum sp. CPCC 100848]